MSVLHIDGRWSRETHRGKGLFGDYMLEDLRSGLL